MKGHPRAKRLKICKPMRLEMSWRTIRNSVDCGIFVKRHMETYTGTNIPQWNCGLAKESQSQVAQLIDIRLKYLTKILLSYINIHKGTIVAEMRGYVKMPKQVKESLKIDVFKRISTKVRKACFNV